MKYKHYKLIYNESKMGKIINARGDFSMMQYHLAFSDKHCLLIERFLQGDSFNMVYLYRGGKNERYFWINFPYILFFSEVI